MAQLPSPSSFGDYADWPGRDVLDSGGERLGGVREIYLDRETGRPEWVLVDVDDAEARFVPLADASVESSTIRIAHDASTVRNAPGIGTEPRIDQTEERRLYAHYGLGYSEDDSGSGLPSEGPPPKVEEPPASVPPWRSSETPGWSSADAGPASVTADAPEAASSQAPAEPESPTALGASDESGAGAGAGAPIAVAGLGAASNDAPPPAEPPSTEELESADIPEPPTATADDAQPALEAPAEPPELPAATAPPELEPSPAESPTAAYEAPADAAELAPPIAVPVEAGVPPAAAEPAVPPLAAADTSAATSFDAPPSRTSPPPRQEPAPAGGPLAVLRSRPGGIAVAAAVALVLLMIIRRLR